MTYFAGAENADERNGRISAGEISQQDRVITGTVLDEAGEPLVGVNISIKGTTTGTASDFDGSFSIQVASREAILVFSFIGYTTQEVTAGSQTRLTVTLREDMQLLDEVVVVGYGTQKRSDITGAIASVGQKDFIRQQTFRSTDILQGRVAGVQVTNTSGSPFADTKIRVRGTNSINGSNDPLYVVNGMVGGGMPAAEDIESIEVLKDASATALYGSRGANGVIIVTTKKGVAGKTQITVDAYGALQTPSNLYDMLDAATFAQAYNYTTGTAAYSNEEYLKYKETGGTDWQRAVLQDAWIQRYRLNISGGTEKVRYYTSSYYNKHDGLIPNRNAESYGFSNRLDADLYDNLKIEWDMGVSRYNNRNSTGGEMLGGATSLLFGALVYSPTDPLYTDEQQTQYLYMGNNGPNEGSPFVSVRERNVTNSGFGASSNMAFTWEIIKGLTAQYRLYLNYSSSGRYEFKNKDYMLGGDPAALGNKDENVRYFQNLVLNYNKTLGEHAFGLTGVVESNSSKSNSVDYENSAFDNAVLGYWGMGQGATRAMSVGYSNDALLSYVGRINYNYAGKYYLTATYRADGSSKFADGKKWGYFPSASVAWRASEEDFVKDLNLFSNLKVRASYGITGSQAVDRYATISKLQREDVFLGSHTKLYGYTALVTNADLTWESTAQTDFGVDLGFLDNRISATVDLYNKDTYDLLLQEPMPLVNGGDRVWRNKGKMNNKGVELALNVIPVATKDLVWEISANLAKNVNKITDIGQDEPLFIRESQGNNDGILDPQSHILQNGLSMGSLYGYKCLGVWQLDEAEEAATFGAKPGQWKYEDVTKDGKITTDDRTVIGCGTPDFIYGLNTSVTWKNFDANLMLQGVQGSSMLNVVYGVANTVHGRSRSITMRDGWENRWTLLNPSNEFADPRDAGAITNNFNVDNWIQNSSFLRIKNLSVGYTFKQNLTKLGDIRIYVSSQNLYTFTKYKGYDPEATSTIGKDTATGIDSGVNPTPRVFTFGAQLKF
ncbi:MAG: TonB-dependent receptor [Tannerella sp.]|nr:TonB-dependent receptor [Tannerella sp.]